MEKLTSLKFGQRAVISTLDNSEWEIKLMEMGCVPGTDIKIERVAPLGDPIVVNVSGYSLSLRKCEAETINIQIVEKH